MNHELVNQFFPLGRRNWLETSFLIVPERKIKREDTSIVRLHIVRIDSQRDGIGVRDPPTDGLTRRKREFLSPGGSHRSGRRDKRVLNPDMIVEEELEDLGCRQGERSSGKERCSLWQLR